MKLSEIVAYRNQLKSINHVDQVAGALNYFDEVEYIVKSHALQISNRSEDFEKIIGDIKTNVSKFKFTIDEMIEQIESIIADREQEYYQESNKIYFEQSCFDSFDLILNRRLKITYENREELMGAVRAHNSWRVPGMIIRPGLEDFIEDLVPLDPLYVIDNHFELIRPSVEKFTPEYQRRLRQYTIKETHDNKIFENLPTEQFGLIFAYNFFNFKPAEVIKRYLEELYDKLRPGGGLVFTFNDCDFQNGVGSVERNFQMYTPGRVIKKYAEDIGFELNREYCQGDEISWLDLVKPGAVNSYRGGQALAKIIAKP